EPPVAEIDVPAMLREARENRAAYLNSQPYQPEPHKPHELTAIGPLRAAQRGDGMGAYLSGGVPDPFCQWLGSTCTIGVTFLSASGWGPYEILSPTDNGAGLPQWVAWENALPGRRLVTWGIPAFAWGIGSAGWSQCASGAFNS